MSDPEPFSGSQPQAHKRALRTLFLCLVCVGLGQSMLFAILPPAAREIGLTPFQVSIIFATSATIWVFVSPLWGRRSDLVGRRPVILIGLLGFGSSMALLAAAIEIGLAGWLPIMAVYPMMIAARSVFALVGSGTGPASQAYVADRTSATERAAGVALVNAALGFGQTIGPGAGAVLATLGLLAPLYFAAAFAAASAVAIWFFLPENRPAFELGASRPARIRARDPRVAPFLILGAAIQAVQSTTTITLAFFLQDTLRLTAKETVQYAGVGFMTLALAGLFTQLVVVQRFKPTAALMLRFGFPLMLLAFLLLATVHSFPAYLVALVALGTGLGFARPGNAAGASLSVEGHEQGSVAGLLSGTVVIGNIFGPLLGTSIFEVTPIGPYVLNALLMAGMAGFVFAARRLRSIRPRPAGAQAPAPEAEQPLQAHEPL